MRVFIYITLILISFSCSQQSQEASYNLEEESEVTATEVTETSEESFIRMTPLEYIILGKLQEIYDLQKIALDSTINKEIRAVAKTSLNNLINETETLEYIKNGRVSNVKLTNDSNHVTFEFKNQLKEAEIDVKKEVVIINGEAIDNIEITVEGIK